MLLSDKEIHIEHFLFGTEHSAAYAAACQGQTPRLAEEHINRGNALVDKGDLDGAIVEYDRAIALDPKQAYYYYNRGMHEKIRAISIRQSLTMTKALSLDLMVPQVYNNRGAARMGKEDLDGAISGFSKALALKPDHANAYRQSAATRDR